MTIAMDGHIVVDDQGVARFAGSRTKVLHVILEQRANGWSAEQLQEQFPHLSLAAIYAALAYYQDHRAQVDAQIEESRSLSRQLKAEATEPPLIQRLRDAGKIP